MDLRAVIDGVPAKISKLSDLVQTVRADIKLYEASRVVVPVSERKAFGEELIDAINGNALRESERVFDVYQGFSVILPANMFSDRRFVFIQSRNGGKYYLEMKKDKPLSCSKSIDYLLDHLCDREIILLAQIKETEKNCESAEADIEHGNPYQSEIELLTKELEEIDQKLSESEEVDAIV